MADMARRLELVIDSRAYNVDVIQKVALPPEAPRIIIVSHILNYNGIELVNACLDGVKHFTPEAHEVWVIDNNSDTELLGSLQDRDDVNLGLNRTEPFPPTAGDDLSVGAEKQDQKNWGSYANAIGLEIGARLIDPSTRYLMSMHMDTCPCYSGWLTFLKSRIDDSVKASGVRLDKSRTPEGVLHVLGYMVDFQVFKDLGLDFFPDLPGMDVGDKVTVKLRNAGYEVFSCKNTLWDHELVEQIPVSSPLRGLQVDRSFDDKGNIIFLHLGRGVRRSIGQHNAGVNLDRWLDVIHNSLLKT